MELVLCSVGIVAIIVCLICNIWMLGKAFGAGVGWGLACMFIPLAGLFFVLTHWDDVGKPFMVSLCSALIFGSIVLTLPSKPGSPSFFSMSAAKADTSSVKANMRTAQLAAESYATDHEGRYPTSVDFNFKSYYPGGSNGGASLSEGSAPVNPFTMQAEWPSEGTVSDVRAARSDSSATLKPGQIEYSVIYDNAHFPLSYAIRGGDSTGKVVLGSSDSPLVLSNQ